MELEKIYEVLAIKQVKRKAPKGFDPEALIVRSPQDAYKIADRFIGDYAREAFLVLLMNTKNKITAAHIAHVGSLNASIVSPREVFQVAIMNNAASMIVAHQHRRRDMFLFY
ncbi:JAB domain-containing protein [Cytobacillus pseudoceanisediminis]